MKFFTLVLSLILILDPLGNVPLFAAILRPFDPAQQRKIILRELLISLGILIAFQFLGELILIGLGISITTVQISGGIVLFLISLGMIFPTINTTTFSNDTDESPFIVPLSVPLVAGPSILAAIMAYSRQIQSQTTMLISIIIAWGITAFILMLTPLLKKYMKDKALTACTRLMGLILTFIAMEMLLSGLKKMVS